MLGFHELYEQHSRDVYRFALFLCGDPADGGGSVDEQESDIGGPGADGRLR